MTNLQYTGDYKFYDQDIEKMDLYYDDHGSPIRVSLMFSPDERVEEVLLTKEDIAALAFQLNLVVFPENSQL